jgi:hypothetical protein
LRKESGKGGFDETEKTSGERKIQKNHDFRAENGQKSGFFSDFWD